MLFLMIAIIAIIAVMIIAVIVIECSEPEPAAADFVVLSRQAARPPEADGLYEGLYEDFVQGNR